MKNACRLTPDAGNGNDSKLFKDLVKRGLSRDAVKKIWAFTKTDMFKNNVPTNIEYDENGEPTIESLSTIIDIDSLVSEFEDYDKTLAKESSIVNSNGKPTVFPKADTALTQASAYNKKSKNTVAVVEQTRDGFKATVKPKTVESLIESDQNESRRELNRALLQILNRLGFNVGFSENPNYYGVFDPLLAEDNSDLLKTVIAIANDELGLEALPEEAAHLIIAGLQGHKLKERLDVAFTDEVVREVLGEEYDRYKKKYAGGGMLAERLREEAEGKMLARMLRRENISEQYENPKNNTILTINRNGIKNLLKRIWNFAKSLFQKASVADIDNAIANAENAVRPIADMIRNGGIETVVSKEQVMSHKAMYDLADKNAKLYELAKEGLIMLKKREYELNFILSKRDNREQRKLLRKIQGTINSQEYALACLSLVTNMSKDVSGILKEMDKYGHMYADSKDLGVISKEAEIVNNLRSAIRDYEPYFETMVEIKSLIKRGQIECSEDIANQIEAIAEENLKRLRVLKKDVRSMRHSVLTQFFSLFVTGENKDVTIQQMLDYAEDDLGIMDTSFFSAADSKSKLMNYIHKIIVQTQARRNTEIQKVTARMQELDKKLRDAGYDSRFVYEYDENGVPTGYYASKYDFYKYNIARERYMQSLINKGLSDTEIDKLVRKWERDNTEEVVVKKTAEGEIVDYFPKLSLYANKNFQKGWSQAQIDYYNGLMQIKDEMDELLPQNRVHKYLAPQVRRSITQMFDKDGRGAVGTILNNAKKEFHILEDNDEFLEKTKRAITDVDGRPLKTVPIYYTRQLDDRKDLSTDATHAMFAYIASSVNYGEMSKIASSMKLLQGYVLDPNSFEVARKEAGKTMTEEFTSDGETYTKVLTVPNGESRLVKAIVTYIDRLLYNDTRTRIGEMETPIGTVDKDAAANMILKITSMGKIGLNFLSGMSNVTQGETQMLTEAASGRFFGFKDYAFAKKEYFKLLWDYLKNFNAADRHDKMYMLINQFNSSEDFFRDMKDKDFNKNPFKRLLGRGNIYFLNSMGEHYLHTSGMLSILKHERVILKSPVKGDTEGKFRVNDEVSLYDVITQVHDKNGWHLELGAEIEFVNKNRGFLAGNLGEKKTIKPSDRDELFSNLSTYINNINAKLHGGYNEAERGNNNQQFLWRMILQFRQWMFGQWNRLYAPKHYDAVLDMETEGAYNTLYKFCVATIADLRNMSLKAALEKNKLSGDELQNVKVAMANAAMFVTTSLLVALTKQWKDDDDRGKKLAAYQILRLRTELGAMFVLYPPTFLQNAMNILDSPAAATSTLEALTGLLDITAMFETVETGRFKGWNKWLRNAYRVTPIYNVQKVIDMKDYNYIFNTFNK